MNFYVRRLAGSRARRPKAFRELRPASFRCKGSCSGGSKNSAWRPAHDGNRGRIAEFQDEVSIGLSRLWSNGESDCGRAGNDAGRPVGQRAISWLRFGSPICVDGSPTYSSQWWNRCAYRCCMRRPGYGQSFQLCAAKLAANFRRLAGWLELQVRSGSARRRAAHEGCPAAQTRSLHFSRGASCRAAGGSPDAARAHRGMDCVRTASRRLDGPRFDPGRAAEARRQWRWRTYPSLGAICLDSSDPRRPAAATEGRVLP